MAIDIQQNQLQQLCYDLGSKQHITRLRAYKQVESILQEHKQEEAYLDLVQRNCLELLAASDIHKIMGGFMAAQLLISMDDRQTQGTDFRKDMVEKAIRHLEDEELRVRQEVCQILGLLASKIGVSIITEKKHFILDAIERDYNRDRQIKDTYNVNVINEELNQVNLNKDPIINQQDTISNQQSNMGTTQAVADNAQGAANLSQENENNILQDLLQAYRPPKPGQGEMRHHTEGYKSLETSVKAIQMLIDGVHQLITQPEKKNQDKNNLQLAQKVSDSQQTLLDQQIDEKTVKILIVCSLHQSKFVRMTAYETLGVIAKSVSEGKLRNISNEIATSLADGLSDHESQVRYCACVASRQLLSRFTTDYISCDIPQIIPPICLNRYYVADGVKNYALETWKLVMKDQGKQVIAQNSEKVLKYYINQTKVKNHAIREAACISLGEVASKIDKDIVEKDIDRIQYTLIKAMKDNSWPVRDSAGVALRLCSLKYPDQFRQVRDPYLTQNLQQLSENVQTVRENSAINIGTILQIYKHELQQQIEDYIDQNLAKAKEQDSNIQVQQFPNDFGDTGMSKSSKNSNNNVGHTQQSNQKSNGMLDFQQIKTRKRGQGGAVDTECCIDAGYTRERQLWEYSDGCVFLVRECAAYLDLELTQLYLQIIEDLLRLDHFPQHYNLSATIFKCLPDIAQNMGKRQFKVYLPNFIPFLFKSLECDNLNCEAAAGEAIQKLRDLIGPTIFDGSFRINL